jgi:hypothetical protein
LVVTNLMQTVKIGSHLFSANLVQSIKKLALDKHFIALQFPLPLMVGWPYPKITMKSSNHL